MHCLSRGGCAFFYFSIRSLEKLLEHCQGQPFRRRVDAVRECVSACAAQLHRSSPSPFSARDAGVAVHALLQAVEGVAELVLETKAQQTDDIPLMTTLFTMAVLLRNASAAAAAGTDDALKQVRGAVHCPFPYSIRSFMCIFFSCAADGRQSD
jgi:hypothetical protein